jgi:hypothetical protein
MNIYVNDEKLNSSLAGERNLGEVYSAVSKWIESQGHYIVHFLVDGVESASIDTLHSISLDTIQRLDFYSGSELELLSQSIVELDRYIELVGNTVFGRDSLTEKESKDIVEGTAWINEVLHSAKHLLKLDYSDIKPLKVGDTVETVLSSLTNLSQQMDTITSIESYLDKLRTLKVFIIDLSNRLSALTIDPATLKELVTTYSHNMDSLKNEFIKVNEAYQSGKDYLANELLNRSTGRLHILISGLISLKSKNQLSVLGESETEFDAVTEKLNSVMGDVVASLENGDVVQAGDLLEYELPSVLDSFVPFLKKVSEHL